MKTVWCIFALALLVTLGTGKKIRAVWLDAGDCPTEEATKKTIEALAHNGINRIYAAAWKRSKTLFRSATMLATIGEEGIGLMVLPWALKYSRQNGMEVYAWFEYGYGAVAFTINTAFSLYALRKGWILGEFDGFYYMDPRTNATEFIVGIFGDAIELGVDGVQFDDHLACPTKFAQCSGDMLIQTAKYVSRMLRAKYGKKAVLSLAPAYMPNAIRDYRVDWREMMKKGYFDELVPLFYTTSAEWFVYSVDMHKMYWGEFQDRVLIGIMVNQDEPAPVIPWDVVSKQIKGSETRGYGVVVWYSKGVAYDYAKEFHELWVKH